MDRIEGGVEGRIRVIHVVDTSGGGVESHIRDLVLGLDRERFSPAVLASPIPALGPLATRLRKEGVAVEMLPRTHGLYDLRAFVHLVRLIRRRVPGIAHIHMPAPTFLSQALPAVKIAGVPIVISTEHSHAFHVHDRSLLRAAAKRLYVLGRIRLEDQMIAVSEAQAETFARVLGVGRAKITVIHNGVDCNRFTPQVDGSPIRAELDIPPSVSLVGMVTGFYDYERCEDFLAAAAQVLFQAPTTRFMIIGGSPGRVADIARKRTELEALARRLGLSAALRFSGLRTDMPQVMAALDVLVLPATFKSFGIAILEAMATGKPVVATDAGGVPEVVSNDETGLLVPPRDPTGLADAILRLIRNPRMAASMGQRGREQVVQRFTAGTTAERTGELYTTLWARRMQRNFESHADLHV